jgi:cell division septation protein DedD
MNEIRLIVDRGSVVRAAIGLLLAAQLVFVAGAVLGFALHGDLPPISDQPPESEQMAARDPAQGPESSVVQAEPAPLEGREAGEPGEAERPRLDAPVPSSPSGPLRQAGEASTTESPQAVTPPVEVAPTVSVGYAIQFGAFRSGDNARTLQTELVRRGYEAIIVRSRAASGDWLHHVRLAQPASTEAEASTVAERFERIDRLAAVAVPVQEVNDR